MVCVFSLQSVTPPQFILWYHDGKMINYDQSRGGITVRAEQQQDGSVSASLLSITNATLRDSGRYTCSATNVNPATVSIFVSRGEI